MKPLHDYETAGLVIDRMRRLVAHDAWHKPTWLSELARMIELANSLQSSEGTMGTMRAAEVRDAALRKDNSSWLKTG